MSKKIGRVKMNKHRKSSPKAKKASAKKPVRKTHKMSASTKKANLEARRALKLQTEKLAAREQAKLDAEMAEKERIRVDGLLENVVFSEFISKNVGKKAISVIKMLDTPQTDEKLAADLEVKINEVRRILNVLDSYGVARYDTNKDDKGWLTFEWHLDREKLTELHQTTLNAKPESSYNLPDNCNDFFYCTKCYEEQKVLLPFDAAFESQFKCDYCGKQLKQLNKDEARAMFEQSTIEGERPKAVHA